MMRQTKKDPSCDTGVEPHSAAVQSRPAMSVINARPSPIQRPKSHECKIAEQTGAREGRMTEPQSEDMESLSPANSDAEAVEVETTMVDWGSSDLHTGSRDPSGIETRSER